jgi:hypothetical protein
VIEGFNAYDMYIHEKTQFIERQIRQGRLATDEQIAAARKQLRLDQEEQMCNKRRRANGLSVKAEVKLRP